MRKLTTKSTQKVLTLSASYIPPKGGIAQVIKNYSTIYPIFNHIATTKGECDLNKITYFFLAVVKFFYFCLLKDIRIVHLHGASHNSFRRKKIFIALAKFFRKKVVYHIHGGEFEDFYKNNPTLVKSVFNRVDAVVALSESWKSFFEANIAHQNVTVIENVVLPPIGRSVKKDGRVHFLFLGRFCQKKGVYDMLDAISENFKYIDGKAVFHMGGNGEVEQVRQRINDLKLDGVVVVEGWVSGDKKVDLLNLADVYILPSYSEALPISILEAMSYSLPIISTPVGGVPEIVVHKKNGFLVAPGNRRAIGEAIVEMLQNETFRQDACKESYMRVQPYFPSAVEEKLETMYRDLLE